MFGLIRGDVYIMLARKISQLCNVRCQRYLSLCAISQAAQKNCLMFIPKQRCCSQCYSTCQHSSKWEQPEGYNTGITIYNPIVKDTVPLILRKEKIAHWYACGPTVYDSSHIGHASSYIRLDIIHRILSRVFDIDVVLVMGVTDIDDKIIHRSLQTGQSIDTITKLNEEEFFTSMRKLHVLPPNVITRVTGHIQHIILFVKVLERKGLAYQTQDGSVYFDTQKYGRYGVFSNATDQGPESDSGKRSNQDFALWKATKPSEPWWESPWGKGRPGWHVECSAMASVQFGSNFDLHSGGEDLIFPHHENELAQSCGYHGNTQWVNYWIHTGHLHLSGQDDKMSKSLKNVISIPELLEKYTANHFRMLCLLTHYRKKLEFNSERMEKAVSTLSTLHSMLNRCEMLVKGQLKHQEIPESELYEKLQSTRTLIKKALADDFNTPQALAHLMRLVKFMNQYLGEGTTSDSSQTDSPAQTPGAMASAGVFIRSLLETLGLESLDKVQDATESSVYQQQFYRAVESVVTTRDKMREFAKNKQFMIETAGKLDIPEDKATKLMKLLYKPLWAMTDLIRDDLLASSNVQIQDNVTGSKWLTVEKKAPKENMETKNKDKFETLEKKPKEKKVHKKQKSVKNNKNAGNESS